MKVSSSWRSLTLEALILLLGCLIVGGVRENELKGISTMLPDEALVFDLKHDVRSMTRASLVPKENEQFGLVFGESSLNNAIRNKIIQVLVVDDVASHQERNLQGDFDAFIEIFAQAVFRLPSFETTQSAGLFNARLEVENIECSDVKFDDIEFNYNQESDQEIVVGINIVDLDIVCNMDFSYDMGILNGGGQAVVTSNDNSIGTVIDVTSDDFNLYPPRDAEVGSCTAEITVDDIALSGGFVTSLMDSFDFVVNELIESEVSAMLCAELDSLDALLESMINKISNELAPYTKPLETWRLDPLIAEQNLHEGTEILSFNEEDGLAKVLTDLMEQANNYFAAEFDNASSQTGAELGINTFLRDNLLRNEGSFTFNMEDLSNFLDPVVVDFHDRLTQSSLLINDIKILGLDSLTRFNPMQKIGDQTYQFDMSWDTLTIEVNATLDIRASSLEDALMDSTGPPVIENFMIALGVDNIDFMIAMFLAVDKNALSELQIGPLLFSENITSCILSAMHNVSITGLSASIGNIKDPILSNFISPGLDRFITSFASAALLMYEDVFLNSVPEVFQTTIRDFMNEVLTKTSRNSQESCRPVEIVDEFLDFRDLFLGPEQAVEVGGYGDQRYGDIGSRMLEFLQATFNAVEDDGTLQINHQIIRPLTLSQSGREGIFRYDEDLISLGGHSPNDVDDDNALFNFIKTFRLTNARIQNVDTLVPPMEFLEPKEDDPYSLVNQVHLGPVARRPLTATVAMVLQLFGQDSDSIIDISFSADSLDILADLYAKIGSAAFLHFPLEDIFNMNCWLALFPSTATTEDRSSLSNQGVQGGGYSFNNFSAIMSSLAPSLRCETCGERSLLPDLNFILAQIQSIGILEERVAPLVEGVVKGFIDQFLVDAPKFCPHSPQYEGIVKTGLQFREGMELTMPILDAKSIDTIAFGAGTIAQVGLVIFADLYHMDTVEPVDPLFKQTEFRPPSEIQSRLLDWTNLDESDSPLIVMGVEVMKSIVDSLAKGGRNLQVLDNLLPKVFDADFSSMLGGGNALGDVFGLDGILDDFIGEDGYFSLQLENIEFEMAGFMFGINSLRIGGLDSFTHFDFFNAIGPQMLMNSFHLETISLQVTLLANSLATSDPPQEFSLSLDMNDITVMVPLLAALNLDKFNSLDMGSLLVLNDILPCLISTFYEAEIVQFNVTVGEIIDLRFDGLMDETESVMSYLSNAILDGFQSSLIQSISSIADNFIRPGANRLMADYMAGSACNNIMANQNNYIDFRDIFLSEEDSLAYGGSGESPYGDLFRFIYSVVKPVMEVNPITGLAAVNGMLIGPLTREQSGEAGTLSFPGEVISQGTSINVGGFKGDLSFTLSDVRIESLDTIGRPFSMLDIMMLQPYHLNNTASMGVGGTPFRLSSRLLLEIKEKDGIDLSNDMQISFDFHAATLVLTALIQVAENRLATFPIRDLLNMECWLATIPAPALDHRGLRLDNVNRTAGIEQLTASLAQLNLQVDCNSCTSPGIVQWADTLSTPGAIDDLKATSNGIIDFVIEIGESELVQMMIDRRLSVAELKCPHNPRYDSTVQDVTYQAFQKTDVQHSSSLILLIVIVGACLLGIISIVVLIVQWIVRRRHRKWLASLSSLRLNQVMRQQRMEDLLESDLDGSTLSMFRSSDIPAFVRFIMPPIIMGNIALFLSGHLSLGATVTIVGEIAGERFAVDDFFDFSIAQSTMELWEAGGRIVAVFILIFSIIWPYSKQLITLFLWFVRPSIVSVSLRGKILLWLDFLAKWSMVDVFTLVLTIAAMRVQIVNPDLNFFPADFYSINFMVVPRWGLYANMIAQLISQISSHFIIHYHRKIIHQATIRHEEQQISEHLSTSGNNPYPLTTKAALGDDQKEALHRHAFARPHRGESDKLIARRYVNYLLCIASLALSILLILGCIIPSFSLEIFGILGLVVESGQDFEPSVTEQSILSVVGLLMNQARLLDTPNQYMGLGTLSALVILCVLIVPLMETFILLYQWFIPMSKKTRLNMSVITEILQAWQYTEVYILSALFTSWQLGPTSEFMLNPYCDRRFRDELASLEYFGILDGRDAQCFQVLASVENATYIIFAGAALLILLNSFVMKATSHYFRDTMKKDPEPMKAPEDEPSWDSVTERVTKIHPVPALFSDVYRWMLVRKEVDIGELSRKESVKTYDLGEDSCDSPVKSHDVEGDLTIEIYQKQVKSDDLQGNPHGMQEMESTVTYDTESNSYVEENNKERAMKNIQESSNDEQKQGSTDVCDLESNPHEE